MQMLSRMKPRSPLVVLPAVALVALLCLFAALEYYRATTVAIRRLPDPFRVGYQEQHFREVAGMLPADAVVGYISNAPFDSFPGAAAFFGAQWALAPRIVVPHDNPRATEFVVGNFSAGVETADIISKIARDMDMHVVRDLDSGVVLFRKGERE